MTYITGDKTLLTLANIVNNWL